MKSSFFACIRFVLAFLTVFGIAGHSHIPPITRQLLPDAQTESRIYGPLNLKGVSSVSWVNRESNNWRCDYKPQFGRANCGVILVWRNPVTGDCPVDSDSQQCTATESDGSSGRQDCINLLKAGNQIPDRDGVLQRDSQTAIIPGSMTDKRSCTRQDDAGLTMDFSDYDRLRVSIHYEGRAKFLRLYIRNYHPEYAGSDQLNDGKLMSAIIRTEDLRAGPIFVDLREFSVEERWVKSVNAGRQQAMPEFSHVTALGVDLIEHGLHKVRVDGIELVGQRFSIQEFLKLIVAFWGGVLLLEVAVRYYVRYRAAATLKSESRGAD